MKHRETYRGWLIEVWPQRTGNQYPPMYAIRKKRTKQGWRFANHEGHTVMECIVKAKNEIDYIDPTVRTLG